MFFLPGRDDVAAVLQEYYIQYSGSVVIDSKYKFVSGDSSRYGYIYNYPLEMLRQPGNGDINTIISNCILTQRCIPSNGRQTT